jgi:MFS family permease
MFAVGWGANQFSPMLIVYRHELGLTAGTLAGLFGIYAAALVPGLLLGGPASDRFGRRPVVIPFVALSPVATLLLVLGPRSLAVIIAGRALAGLCSGVVFGAATAWVRELSADAGVSARRSAIALSAGFGLGPLTAALLAQWAPDPLVLPYLAHLVIGAAAIALVLPTPETSLRNGAAGAASTGGAPPVPGTRWPPGAVRTARFWLAVAPAAPWVFGCAALSFVVLPQEVTSARSLSAAFAGVATALTLGMGIAVQPVARRIEARRRMAGTVTGLICAAAAAALAAAAVAVPSQVLALACAMLFGLGYGCSLVSGLHEVERLAGRNEQGAVVACYYVLTYVGFAAPYLVDWLNGMLGKQAAFGVLAAAAAAIAAWTAAFTSRSRGSGSGRRMAAAGTASQVRSGTAPD